MSIKEDTDGTGVASRGRLKQRRLPIAVLSVRFCAICQQQRKHGWMPLEGRQMQRSGAILDRYNGDPSQLLHMTAAGILNTPCLCRMHE